MTFSGQLKLFANGRMAVPPGSTGCIEVLFVDHACKLVTNVSSDGKVFVPKSLLAYVHGLPAHVDVKISTSSTKVEAPTLVPLGDVFRFRTTPRFHKASYSTTIPAAWARGLAGWVQARVEAGGASRIVTLEPNIQGVVNIALPLSVGEVEQDITLTRAITELVEKPRAHMFDWGAIEAKRRVSEGDRIVLPRMPMDSNHQPRGVSPPTRSDH